MLVPLSRSSSISVADVSSDVLDMYESMDPGREEPEVWPDRDRRKWPRRRILHVSLVWAMTYF